MNRSIAVRGSVYGAVLVGGVIAWACSETITIQNEAEIQALANSPIPRELVRSGGVEGADAAVVSTAP